MTKPADGTWVSGAPPGNAARGHALIPVRALGMGLGTFLVITYLLCIGFDLLFPSLAMSPAWAPLLPGFTWLTWPGFLIGLVDVFAYGWYVALVFAPLYNYFAGREG